MVNRWYDQRKEKKLGPSLPAPSPGLGSVPVKKFEKEGSNPFPGAPGKKGRDLNAKVKFPRVKDAVKKDY